MSDFTLDVKDQIKTMVAVTAGVDSGAVDVLVQAGSVIVTIIIRAPTRVAATAAGNAIAGEVVDAASATAFFSDVDGGINVQGVAPLVMGTDGGGQAVHQSMRERTEAANSGLGAPALAAIAVGGIVAIVFLTVVARFLTRKKKAKKKAKKTDFVA